MIDSVEIQRSKHNLLDIKINRIILFPVQKFKNKFRNNLIFILEKYSKTLYIIYIIY